MSGTWHWHNNKTSCKTIVGLSALKCVIPYDILRNPSIPSGSSGSPRMWQKNERYSYLEWVQFRQASSGIEGRRRLDHTIIRIFWE
ncbi:Glucose-6-phosphate isomerase [Gossypium arboreum]|uniref:Glucose-6-phosphate isomerase n=1 Tax=Gossypium arboreum TaxID=29729 RepID=A0A0B0MUX4_GOSAR|nr:Glucose-6-phosphate isomerase [Gossypium arboreum]